MMARVRFERAHEYSWWAPGRDDEGVVTVSSVVTKDRCELQMTRNAEITRRLPIEIHHDELEVVIAALINYKKYTEANENEDPSDE